MKTNYNTNNNALKNPYSELSDISATVAKSCRSQSANFSKRKNNLNTFIYVNISSFILINFTMDLNTVKDYYTTHLNKSDDLKTNACCTDVVYPKHIKKILSELHDETISKYYGCGLTIPSHLKNLRILD